MFSPGAAGGISGEAAETFGNDETGGRGLFTTAAGEGFKGECGGVTMRENKNSGNINQTQQGRGEEENGPTRRDLKTATRSTRKRRYPYAPNHVI